MQYTMAFHTDAFVLLEQWTTGSTLGLLLAMIVACAVGGLYEWLSRFLYNWDKTPLHVTGGKRCRRFTLKSLRSAFHALSVTVSYLLMLLLMTYNLWVMISLLIGCAIGYFLLGPKFDPQCSSRRKKPEAKPDPSRGESAVLLSGTKDTIKMQSESEIPLEAVADTVLGNTESLA